MHLYRLFIPERSIYISWTTVTGQSSWILYIQLRIATYCDVLHPSGPIIPSPGHTFVAIRWMGVNSERPWKFEAKISSLDYNSSTFDCKVCLPGFATTQTLACELKMERRKCEKTGAEMYRKIRAFRQTVYKWKMRR